MAHWNFGDLFDSCGEILAAETPALIHGDRVVNWGDLTRRSNNLAQAFLDQGAVAGDKVAIYMRNCPEYCETLVACFKARLVPVNVNYRYLDDELHYILDNSDAVVAVYGAEFQTHVSALESRLPNVHWLGVGEAYEQLANGGSGEALGIERSGDDLLFIYTGGTTGMPKAVMWRQEDLWYAMGSGNLAPSNQGAPVESPVAHVENLRNYGQVFVQLVSCPIMHGTGMLTSIATLSGGGSIVTLCKPGLDVEELWDTVQKQRVNGLIIVGDAFAKPMLKALEQEPERWDISSLQLMLSSGVMWSPAVKVGLLNHNSNMLLMDSFGSSEALGFGASISGAGETARSARFTIGPDCKVFNEEFDEVAPGSGERGFIARPGPIPLGYYKDEKKTAETFPTINGVRYAIPGDWCTVDKDGTLNLLGRGSACINSAGEKIYPEEVEEALKTHAKVDDALVFGVDDEKWGQAVTAVVLLAGEQALGDGELRNHVRGLLADYKSPKAIYTVKSMFRAPNGKADYKAAKAYVQAL
ncbi:MAG: acyl-CoA synthetase [Proteobacteria bacterium]|nr:acyl-CoA synthetase [Pseudomonadota bacterium]